MIADIHCPKCGAPAVFDIYYQKYQCQHCGSKVEISEAQEQKLGFRKMRGEHLQTSVKQFRLFSASCEGCGAKVIFEENEALSNCAFCGRSMTRKEYIHSKGMPESVIPFRITQQEATERLAEWCRDNKGKREAKHLEPLLSELKGFYLPYELVRGPVHMTAERMDGGKKYSCEGYLFNEFVNRSAQLDNLLLDGMEPFDLQGLTEFDFAYVAGHRVKTSDVADKELESRVRREVEATYKPSVRKVLETKAIDVDADVSSAMRLPVLLPVYYISSGNTVAAVNGQTGKVSVREEKESHYYFLPWWLKAILATVIVSGGLFGALYAGGFGVGGGLYITGMFAIVMLVIMLCLYSDTVKNPFFVNGGREIFTSGEQSFHRENGRLVQDDSILERKVVAPTFYETIEGKKTPVVLRFTTPYRVGRMIALALGVMFLPVILALLINGFDFHRLTLGGSAVWFCITVPTVPVYLVKFGIVQLYERPWIYIITPEGKRKRYKEKGEPLVTKETVKTVLAAFFTPPICFGIWFGILCFFTMVYLTAFGFGD